MLKEKVDVPVVSNGNVRMWEDVQENRRTTGADGVMVGETLLGNPWWVFVPLLERCGCMGG